jgi:hypothetical protein
VLGGEGRVLRVVTSKEEGGDMVKAMAMVLVEVCLPVAVWPG